MDSHTDARRPMHFGVGKSCDLGPKFAALEQDCSILKGASQVQITWVIILLGRLAKSEPADHSRPYPALVRAAANWDSCGERFDQVS